MLICYERYNMLKAIWAQSQDGIIGDGLDIPWYIPEDFQHFKSLTQDSNIIMGRKTWESLPKKPLPNRNNYVLSSHQSGQWSQGAQVIYNINQSPDDGWVIGGQNIYEQYLDKVTVIEQTCVKVHLAESVSVPIYAPRIPDDFTIVEETEWTISENPHDQLYYKFVTWKRN